MLAKDAIEGKLYSIPRLGLINAELAFKSTHTIYFLTFDEYAKRKIRPTVLTELIEESK